jgi:outer membrane protein TolC
MTMTSRNPHHRVASGAVFPTRLAASLALAVSLALGSCVSSALEEAPQDPSKPWTPVETSGAGADKATRGESFAVPANPAVAQIDGAPEIRAGKTYGLADLIDIAQSHNPATRLAWQQARQAALSQGMVEATFLPVISASLVSGRQRVGARVDSSLLPGSLDLPTTTASGVTPVLSVQWLLFDFGQRSALHDAAKHNSLAANVLFNGAHQKVIFDVTRSYFLYGAARSRTRIAMRTLANAQEIEAAAKARMANGLGNAVEVAQGEQQVAQARFNLVQARGAESAAYQAQLGAMGISPMTRVQIRDASGRELSDKFAAPTESLIRQALARRPDVLASYSAAQASRAGVKAAQAEFMPKVFLSAAAASGSSSLSTSGLPTIGQQGTTTGFLVGANMPLFDGGLRSAQLQKAEALADSSETVFNRVRADAVREIIVAADTLRSALASYRAATALVRAAGTTYDAALASYKAGTGSITLAAAADNGLLTARQAQADAHAASLVAASSLAFVLGAMNSSATASELLTRAGYR